MNTRKRPIKLYLLIGTILAWPAMSGAQVPVDESGRPLGQVESEGVTGSENLPILSAAELEELVGPVALYPDDLLAIVLPASTYPLQIVQAARFLEDLKNDASLKPDEGWDDSVVALTNYPEVVKLMSEDLDWTWKLGEAVVAQQTDVITAIESFRDRAYAAGNLKSDDFQTVKEDDGVIEIIPVQDDIIYVPYYEPERVVVYQRRPVYYYYPRAYPVYYYPYPSSYAFHDDFFWGVTTAFSIGWYSNHLRVWHHSYHGHPYYGHYYYRNWWYRRPDIHIHKNYYVNSDSYSHHDRYRRGDYWQPRTRSTVRSSDQRVTRTRHYPSSTSTRTATSTSLARSSSDRDRTARRSGGFTSPQRKKVQEAPRPDIRFRDREPRVRNSDSQRSLVRQSQPGTTKQATETRSRRPEVMQPQVRRQTQARQPQLRQPTVRQPTTARRSLVRQPKASQRSVRQSQSRQPSVNRSQSRQPQVRQSQPRQQKARQAAPEQSRSRSSQSRKSDSSRRSSDRGSDRHRR